MSAQEIMPESPGRIAPARELVNAFEFEAMAQRSLGDSAFRQIAGSERCAFERITFRPRMMVNTTKLDLTVELFGQKMFAPILVGPVSEQKRFHPEGELAAVRGAAAAKTAVVVSARSSFSLPEIAARTEKAPLWYQAQAGEETDEQLRRIDQAVQAGAKTLCITAAGADWSAIGRLRKRVGIPCVVKGILSADDARAAVSEGLNGIVISNYEMPAASHPPAPIEVLPSIADAVAGKTVVLIDGSFRRGSDILKALALGARAVLLARPVMWALAAYGAAGVQTLLEMLQTELARDMAMCGKPNLQSLDPSVVRIHARGPGC